MNAQQLRLYHHIQVTAQRIKKAADLRLRKNLDISTAQAAVLAVIAEHGTVSQRQLATSLDLNESAITAMVERLGKLDLIKRQRSTTDGRVWHLSLTAAGQDKVRQSADEFRHINQGIEAALSQEELTALATALRKLGRQFSASVND